jgi:hypothetical protein
MTCAENREQHSALLDGELPAPERALVEAHLAGCAECSAELARLARMLGMLHALPAERAPLGFVDRVLAVARPTPWYVRAWRGLTQPWRLKLPLEAGALVIVALGAVYVFQKTPELQQAARYEAPAPSSTPAPAPAAPLPAQESTRAKPSAPAPAAAPPSSTVSRDANRAESSKLESAPTAPAPPPAEEAAKPSGAVAPLAKESDLKDKAASTREAESLGEKKKTGGARMDAQAPPAASTTQPAPAPQSAPTQPEPRRQRLGGAAPGAPEAARAFTPPDASGRLSVGDREAAERALIELRGRLGVTEAFRRDAGDGDVVIEMIVPRGALADFTRGLDGIGRWTWDRDPSTLPPRIRLQILLAR